MFAITQKNSNPPIENILISYTAQNIVPFGLEFIGKPVEMGRTKHHLKLVRNPYNVCERNSTESDRESVTRDNSS